MSQPRADDTSVRFSPELSEGEKKATRRRKVKVLECLNNLGISCDEKTMPNIAVLGSGGGLRAMIALLGTLTEMKKQGLLDAVMYLCGVSGSTWCMSTLYNGKDWAENIEALEEKLCNDLYWTPVNIQKQLDWVTKAADGVWFEFTPDECGFPGLEVFVRTKYFGSKFQGGNLTELKEEKHMSYLQSLWGSALGSMQENIHYLFAHIKGLFERGQKALNFAAVYEIFNNEMARFGSSIADYRSNPENTVWTRLRSYFEVPLKTLKFVARSKKFFERFKTCYDNWTWGITNNFLYENGNVQTDGLDEFEVFNLIDAGVANNCAYPLVLRPARRVGLILSFDFCIEGSFETLKKASKYCVENQIPFPPIDPEVSKDQANPSNCYIFEGKDTPTVMHFPLFNTKNCPGPEELRNTRIKFPTLRMSYAKHEMEELLNKAKMNVAENKEKILEQIQKIVSSPTRGF